MQACSLSLATDEPGPSSDGADAGPNGRVVENITNYLIYTVTI